MDLEMLRQRLDNTRPLRVTGQSSVLTSEWSPDQTGYNGGRSSKPIASEPGGRLAIPQSECWACSGAHPPNLLAFDTSWKIPDDQETLRIGAEWLAHHGKPTPKNVHDLFARFAPYNLRGRPRLRLLHNAFPVETLGHRKVVESLVCVANEEGHNTDVSQCTPETVTAMFEAFTICTRYAAAFGLTPIPGINGGLQRTSGASSACAHGQIWLLQAKPPLYEEMTGRRRQLGRCPLCAELRRPELQVRLDRLSNLRLIAHPTPERSWTLLIAPIDCTESLHKADCEEWAAAYIAGVRGLTRRLGAIPAYNFYIRIGAGHIHAEIMPRTTNIPGAMEKAARLATIDVQPAEVGAAIAEALAF